MSLLGPGKLYDGNGKCQNIGLSMCGGKEPYGFKLHTSSNGIKISGTADAIDRLVPYVARALVNYALDMKKNPRP